MQRKLKGRSLPAERSEEEHVFVFDYRREPAPAAENSRELLQAWQLHPQQTLLGLVQLASHGSGHRSDGQSQPHPRAVGSVRRSVVEQVAPVYPGASGCDQQV
jgi:hypothetical protein